MNLPDGLLPPVLVWGGFLLLLPVLGLAIRHAPWRALVARPERVSLFLGATLALVLLWSLRADVTPGLSLHFLGITALTLIVGWSLAMVVGTLAYVGYVLAGMAGWEGLGIGVLVSVLLPATLTQVLLWVSRHALPPNFFIYVFVNAFAAAILSALMVALTTAGLFWAADFYSWDQLVHNYLRMMPLLALPEGVVNGMVMTALTLVAPHWVISFDEDFYFKNR
ncbi:MAG: energy-coupling factor ABC transporter permease [Halothiobacillaceae bacterium]